ncbi:MAG: zeta toxin family protein [Candidatus Melainabacteria bacterium]|nr:zeta toxin family protein [Candidatus Melainabacteria bacterium]
MAFTLASNFLSELFLPFVDHFTENLGQNPYQHFYQQGKLDIFPYPALMLWILALPKIIFAPLADISINFELLLMRIPILLADMAILLVLLRWLKNQPKLVMGFYWLSPVLIYINYIHGQLDAIPIAFLFLSLHLLFKEEFIKSFALLAAALMTKTHIVLVVPFYLFFVFKSRKATNYQYASLGLLLLVSLFLFGNSPYFFSQGFQELVLHNSQQGKVFDTFLKFPNDLSFYLIPAVYLVLLLQSLNYKSYSREIFVMFLGFSFGIITVFVPPMQGWYYWTFPFFVYFYIREQSAPRYNFLLLNLAYFAYFALIPNSDYQQVFQFVGNAGALTFYEQLIAKGLDSQVLLNLAFTVLQTTMLVNCSWIYIKGIRSNLDYKIKNKPLLVGVGGNSGAGKSTFSNLLEQVFAAKNTTIVRGDDMHKYERGAPEWKIYTHLNPKANKLHEDFKQAQMLKEGEAVKRQHYDHTQGRFTLPQSVQANRIVVYEGLHPFYLPAMRRLYDFKVFMKPDPELLLKWKLARDTEERGHSEEKVVKQIEDRKEDASKYIEVQEKHADMVVSYGEDENLVLEFNSDIELEPCVSQLEAIEKLSLEHYYEEDKQFLRFEGSISKYQIEEIAYDLLPELEDITLAEPIWEADDKGLLQLFAAYAIFKKMEFEIAKHV